MAGRTGLLAMPPAQLCTSPLHQFLPHPCQLLVKDCISSHTKLPSRELASSYGSKVFLNCIHGVACVLTSAPWTWHCHVLYKYALYKLPAMGTCVSQHPTTHLPACNTHTLCSRVNQGLLETSAEMQWGTACVYHGFASL